MLNDLIILLLSFILQYQIYELIHDYFLLINVILFDSMQQNTPCPLDLRNHIVLLLCYYMLTMCILLCLNLLLCNFQMTSPISSNNNHLVKLGRLGPCNFLYYIIFINVYINLLYLLMYILICYIKLYFNKLIFFENNLYYKYCLLKIIQTIE